jgi:hypothetical protein
MAANASTAGTAAIRPLVSKKFLRFILFNFLAQSYVFSLLLQKKCIFAEKKFYEHNKEKVFDGCCNGRRSVGGNAESVW